MRRKPLWIRGLQNQQSRATKEAISPLYNSCLTNHKNTLGFCNLRYTILWRQRPWMKDLGWQHEANGLNQDMISKLSAAKRFEKSSQISKLQYLPSWIIWHSPYSLGFWAPSRKIEKRGRQEQGIGNDQAVEVSLSASTYGGSCSALLYLYHDSGKNKEETYPQLWPKLSAYKKFSRRIEAS